MASWWVYPSSLRMISVEKSSVKQRHRPLCGSWHLAFTRVLCLSENPVGIVWKVLFWTWLLLYLIVPRGRHAIRGKRECVCPWIRWSCLGYRIQSAYNLHPRLIYAHCDTPKLSDIMGPPTSVHICQIIEEARCSQLNKARTCFLCRKGAQQCRKYKEPDRSLSAPITFLLQWST